MNLDELEEAYRKLNAYDEPFVGHELAHCAGLINRAFPDLLALARDGERYRWLRDKTDAVNAWDRRQDGWGGGCGPDYLDERIDAMKERT